MKDLGSIPGKEKMAVYQNQIKDYLKSFTVERSGERATSHTIV